MILKAKKIEYEGDSMHISSRVISESLADSIPDTLSFTLPKTYQSSIPEDMNGFLTALLPVAMFAGEDIHVEGSVSTTLLYNLREYQKTLHFWRPQWFSIVAVTYDSLAPSDIVQRPQGIMSSFSGGADSMYTFLSHLPEYEENPDFQMTHTLFIESFDTPIIDHPTQRNKVVAYGALMEKLDIAFVPCATNAKDFYYFNNGYAMAMTYPAMLIGVAQLIGKKIGTFHYSADNTHDFPMISTISHTLVPLLSTDALRADVFGASVTKMEKLERIVLWPESYEHLTVCWEKPDGLHNCGECVKCCHTTAGLDMLGALEKYTTFPPTVNRQKIRSRLQNPEFFYFSKTWAEFARAYGRKDYVFDFTYVLWRNRILHFFIFPISHFFTKLIRTPFVISKKLKEYSPWYARFIYLIKKT
mgnify:FL=1